MGKTKKNLNMEGKIPKTLQQVTTVKLTSPQIYWTVVRHLLPNMLNQQL